MYDRRIERMKRFQNRCQLDENIGDIAQQKTVMRFDKLAQGMPVDVLLHDDRNRIGAI